MASHVKLRGFLRLFCGFLLAGLVASAHADISRGKSLYERYCAECHGMDGQSNAPDVPSFRYGDGSLNSDRAWIGVINHGKGVMPAYQGLLSDEEIQDIIFYLRMFLP